MKDKEIKRIQDKVKKLRDSMDVIRARSKTFKDEKDIHAEEILASLDDLEKAVKELKRTLKKK